jgi:hypothetical protein
MILKMSFRLLIFSLILSKGSIFEFEILSILKSEFCVS